MTDSRPRRDALGRVLPGTTLGADTRWTPGRCPNPNGRPKKDAWLRELERSLENEPDKARALADRILSIALDGPDGPALSALREIQDRIGGPVALRVEGLGEQEFVERLVALGEILLERIPREHHDAIADAIRTAMAGPAAG